MSDKTDSKDDASDDHSAFDTQPMQGPDGTPVKPAVPNLNDPAFATQIVPPGGKMDETASERPTIRTYLIQ